MIWIILIALIVIPYWLKETKYPNMSNWFIGIPCFFLVGYIQQNTSDLSFFLLCVLGVIVLHAGRKNN